MPLSESFGWLIDSRGILTVNKRRHYSERNFKDSLNNKEFVLLIKL